MTVATRPAKRLKRRRRVRAKVTGTAERPRISVFRSNRGVFAQLIDDAAGRTLAAVNWTEDDLKTLPRMEQAKRAGELLAERAKAAGVESAVFDRGGYRYHGRVRALAKGARRFSFTALVVVGDENGIVGAGYGKANEVPLAIQKGVERAKKNLFRVPRHGATITHQTTGVFGSGRVFLKPASPGTGVIAGGGVRAVLELAGIHDILSKSLGSQNPINLVKATIAGLQDLRRPEEIAKLRGLSVDAVLGLSKAPEAPSETVAAEEPAAEAEAPAEETSEEQANA